MTDENEFSRKEYRDLEQMSNEAVIGMVNLRLNTPEGEWLSPRDADLFYELATSVESHPEGDLVLSLVNLASHLAKYAATVGRLSPQEVLSDIGTAYAQEVEEARRLDEESEDS